MRDRMRILLAEDNPQDVELMLVALDQQSLSGDVMVVNDGAEALDYLFARGKYEDRCGHMPSVVFLDLKMPKVDGLEVLRSIKTDERLKTIPVVMLTSSREDRDVDESYRCGANAYVVKPLEFDQFVDTVKHVSVFWTSVNEPPPGSVLKEGTRVRG